MPVVVIEAMRFRAAIHQIDCAIPEDISIHLSAGLKYLFPAKFNKRLIWTAWDDFTDRLRWQLRFKLQEDPDALDDSFDPDYYVPPTKRKVAGYMGEIFEHGIQNGQRYLDSRLSQMPEDNPSESVSIARNFAPKAHLVQSYLTSHKLVVTTTDKNLGSAVSSADWIKTNTLKMLRSDIDYRAIDDADARHILTDKMTLMYRLSDLALRYDSNEQLPTFFTSIVDRYDSPSSDLRKSIPTFYVIPKIHKNPVKARPIVPCHSVLQAPAGKFVSKMLKPIIQSAPFIIHGSKDLAIKFSKLQLPRWKADENGSFLKLYIISGDVVAFYPHVNVPLAHQIAEEYFSRHYNYVLDEDVLKYTEMHRLFHECLSAADDQLIMQYDGQIYEQVRGLAMGVASSPDLANLYGLHHEEKSAFIKSWRVPFYGRYIDDCLALVYASSEAEALFTMQEEISYVGCEIEWQASDSYSVFLDMELFFEDNTFFHRAYRKPLNHFERIPWISFHPDYVKRGTFLGELSRVATLCSRFDDYLSACKDVIAIYIARGYPVGVVDSWFRQNYQARWESRIRETKQTARENVLVLKSEYNPVWDTINAQQLGAHLTDGWADALRRWAHGDPDFGEFRFPETRPAVPYVIGPGSSGLPPKEAVGLVWKGFGDNGEYLRLDKTNLFSARFLVSKKRGKNLADLASIWKKHVLEVADEAMLGPIYRRPGARILYPEDIEMPASPVDSEMEFDRSGPPILREDSPASD